MTREEKQRDAAVCAQTECRHEPMPYVVNGIYRCRICYKLFGRHEGEMILERRKIEREKV